MRTELDRPKARGVLRRRSAIWFSAALIGSAVLVATASASAGPPSRPGAATPAEKEAYVMRLEPPATANPYVAFRATADAGDLAAWNLYLNAAGKQRAGKEAPGAPRQGLRVREREAPGGSSNDVPGASEHIAKFGSSAGKRPAAEIAGTTGLLSGSVSAITITELDGSLGTATDVALAAGDSATGSGTIGDEPAPYGDVDFDFFRVPGLIAGQTLTVDIDTPDPFGDLDPFVAVWNPALAPFEIAINDDDGSSFDSFLSFTVPVDGDYFVSVAGFGSFVPVDPTDPASPSVTGEVGSEGVYDVTLALPLTETDYYSFDLRAGDVVGASSSGGAIRLELYDSNSSLVMGSSQDVSFIAPAVSGLPGGGNATVSHVAPADGRYALGVIAGSDYVVDLRVFRPAKERTGNATQAIFVDFDGAALNTATLGGPPNEVSLSPLSSFLPAWGLSPTDEDAVIDAILSTVEETLSHDLRSDGGNGDRDAGDGPGAFDIEILNSRDHADPWGDPYVSRLVVGGTIDEFGLDTIGLAQSIDVGDFESEESAVILLDLLSGTGPFPEPEVDLKNIPRDPGATIIDLIGVAVGNITAHEAGHFFANFHTDQFNSDANIMDQGGNLAGTIGLGPDGIFGTPDDVDVDFGPDEFVPNEGFAGTEDTLQQISFGLSTGRGRGNR